MSADSQLRVAAGVDTSPFQVAPMGDVDALAARIRHWQQGGRPCPAPDPRFASRRVALEWIALLERI